MLPFADAATAELPISQACCACRCSRSPSAWPIVLLIGTLNRVMIVELGVPVWLVATMISLPLIFAPVRGRSSISSPTITSSALGWKRVPYLWFGTMLQFGGLSIMPFALILLEWRHPRPARSSGRARRRSPSF